MGDGDDLKAVLRAVTESSQICKEQAEHLVRIETREERKWDEHIKEHRESEGNIGQKLAVTEQALANGQKAFDAFRSTLETIRLESQKSVDALKKETDTQLDKLRDEMPTRGRIVTAAAAIAVFLLTTVWASRAGYDSKADKEQVSTQMSALQKLSADQVAALQKESGEQIKELQKQTSDISRLLDKVLILQQAQTDQIKDIQTRSRTR